MIDLHPGDRIEIVFVDAVQEWKRATVCRFLSDQQEGLESGSRDLRLLLDGDNPR